MKTLSARRDGGPLARAVCQLEIIGHWLWPLRLQSILTLVTMAIGSFSLAATIFLSSGALNSIWKDVEKLMGSRVDVIAERPVDDLALRKALIGDFTALDLERIRAAVPWAKYIAPMFSDRFPVQSRSVSLLLQIDGIDASMTGDELYLPLSGRRMSEEALKGLVFECLPTASAAAALNVQGDGRSFLFIGGYRAKVVGIAPDPPETTPRFRNRIAIPYIWAETCFGKSGQFNILTFSWKTPQEMEKTMNAVLAALDRVRGPGTYFPSSSQFRVESGRRIVRIFTLLGTSQALFLILIAAVGIMSVMLSNVIRRSRELAIRAVMGADPKDLARLMLLESLLMALFGAFIGILAAMFAAPAAASFLSSKVSEAAGLRPSLSIQGFLIPLLVCGVTGLAAGWAPARRTRRLDILMAIRSE
ncbi:MAG: ABC transporter permease [Acidobacteriota bacterium]|nr:ABC transporter permease [Acidobacteriota bacterium]